METRSHTPSLSQQVWSNQIWETVGFGAKASFLLLLTPLMISRWGSALFGEFALASSMVVFVSMVDLGIRGTTRVDLSHLHSAGEVNLAKVRATEALSGILVNILLASLVMIVFTWLGLPQSIFGISEANRFILLITTLLSSLVLLFSLCAEPLVASGRLGEVKQALAAGSLIAIPLVWAIVFYRGNPTLAIVAWQGALALSLLGLLVYRKIWRYYAPPERCLSFRIWKKTVFGSLWFHTMTMTSIGKTHGLTMVVSAISGTTAAGVFFVVLRLAEIVSSLGAVSSEVLINALPYCKTTVEKKKCLQSVNKMSLLLGGLCAVLLSLAGPPFLALWLKKPPVFGWATGFLAASYGLSTAFRQTTCNALTGLGRIQFAAKTSIVEGVLALGGAIYCQHYFGLAGTIWWVTITSLVCVPSAMIITRACGATFPQIWCWPWASQLLDTRSKTSSPLSKPGTE